MPPASPSKDGSLAVRVVGSPTQTSDAAIARFFTSWLEREQPGTKWTAPGEKRAA